MVSGAESRIGLTHQSADSAWASDQFKGNTVAINGFQFERLVGRYLVYLPRDIMVNLKSPDFKIEIAPDFLDVKSTKDMKKRVQALAAMYY